MFGFFSLEELKIIRKLSSPDKVQEFVDSLEYNSGKRISASAVLAERKADCLESAVFASFVLSFHGIKNFVMDLSSVRDEDHVLCVFFVDGRYGAIGMSKFLNLRYRNPVYRNLDELALSYFEHYFNFFGEYTLRGRSFPLRLKFSESTWRSSKFMEETESVLQSIKRVTLIKKDIKKRVSKVKFQREILVLPKTKIGKKYG